MENFKRVHDLIRLSHRFCLRQIWLNPVWLGGLRSPASIGLNCRPYGLHALTLTVSPPAKLNSEEIWQRCGAPNLVASLNHIFELKLMGMMTRIMMVLYDLLSDYREPV
ncbi:MAG: hypothetical protein GY696_20625 [Gammaproteobacteria bacterium]|nr:hypothetical protein [Gammaproteobacteria bacterium]